jgi:biopolymer transport protein ExbB
MLTNIVAVALNLPTESSQTIVQNTGNIKLSFLSLFLKGGYILLPIVLLSLISVYLIIKKAFELKENLTISQSTLDIFHRNLRKGDLEAAIIHLKSQQTCFSRIYLKVLGNIGRPIKEIENTIESASNIEVTKITKGLGYLGLIAGIAPMLGFIGTISGIIKIFYNISLTDNISIGIISGGLYEKMISSGSGLIVGVVAFTGYHILNMKITSFISRVEEESFEFLDILSN